MPKDGLWERHVVLYFDGSPESEEAEKLLVGHHDQIILEVERVTPRVGEYYPTAVYKAWVYEGIEKIRILCGQLAFNARRADAVKTEEKPYVAFDKKGPGIHPIF